MATEHDELDVGENPALIYLDSNFYFDYLITNRREHAVAKRVVDAWKAGEVEIATSALTIAEVLYVKIDDGSARMMIDRSREPDILDLFQQYGARRFKLVELDRRTAESARQIVWDHGIHPKDAIHVASALKARCPAMFTRDKKLRNASGKLGGQPKLQITVPVWMVQTSLEIDEAQQPS